MFYNYWKLYYNIYCKTTVHLVKMVKKIFYPFFPFHSKKMRTQHDIVGEANVIVSLQR